MPSEWFVKTYNGAEGPFSSQELLEQAKAGSLRGESLVRRGVGGDWRAARQIQGLLEAIRTASKPPQAHSPREGLDHTWIIAAIIFGFAILVSSSILVLGLRPKPRPEAVAGRPKAVPVEAELAVRPRAGALRKPADGDANAEPPLKVAAEDAPPAFNGQKPAPRPTVVPATAPPQAPATRPLADVIADVEPSVALIQGARSSGTGFVIKPGIVATNKHVVQRDCVDQLKLHFPSAAEEFQQAQKVRIIFKDRKRDLAYLQVSKSPPPLRVASDHEFKRGQEVTVVGNPGMADGNVLVNAVSKGVISTKATIKDKPYYQLGISINPGNSGGPVLDEHGSVVGVVTLKDREKEGMGFCIPPYELADSIALMDQLADHEIEKLNDDHDFQVVLFDVTVQGIMAKVRMESLVSAMRRAIDTGGTANDGVRAVSRESGLEVMSRDEAARLRAAVASIAKNPRYPEATRQRMADFWATVQAMVSYAEDPRGNADSYNKKSLELADDFDRELIPLEVLVGSPWDE